MEPSRYGLEVDGLYKSYKAPVKNVARRLKAIQRFATKKRIPAINRTGAQYSGVKVNRDAQRNNKALERFYRMSARFKSIKTRDGQKLNLFSRYSRPKGKR